MAAKYLLAKRGEAKRPPTDDQGNLDDVEETKRRRAQKWKLPKQTTTTNESFQEDASKEGVTP
jgi:hypothetical protein